MTNWRAPIGHKTRDGNGYTLVKLPDHPRANKYTGYVHEHIIVMEQMLGRPLKGEEEINHKNGVNNDNRPENLELFSNHGSHQSYHMAIRRYEDGIDERICSSCGSKETLIESDDKYSWSKWRRSRETRNWICHKCYMVEYRKSVNK